MVLNRVALELQATDDDPMAGPMQTLGIQTQVCDWQVTAWS